MTFNASAFENAVLCYSRNLDHKEKIIELLNNENYEIIDKEIHFKVPNYCNVILYKNCCKCGKYEKDTQYPLCYACFSAWDKTPWGSEERKKWWGLSKKGTHGEDCDFLPTSSDEEEEDNREPTPPSRAYSTHKGQKHPADEYEDWKKEEYEKEKELENPFGPAL